MKRVWDDYLSAQDKAHLESLTERQPYGCGRKAAVISIDNYRWAVGDKPEELLEAVKTWPGSTGLAGWRALDRIKTLFAVARDHQIPIVHFTGLTESESGVASWAKRSGSTATSTAPLDPEMAERRARRFDIVEQAAPQAGEAVLKKTGPSVFFGTPLVAHLNALDVDTLIVCGESTSGCVRASVVDARAYRYRVIVVEDCVYDRHETAHAINLFDMHRKYADVISLDEAVTMMKSQAVNDQGSA